jgi:hypothetical protein
MNTSVENKKQPISLAFWFRGEEMFNSSKNIRVAGDWLVAVQASPVPV